LSCRSIIIDFCSLNCYILKYSFWSSGKSLIQQLALESRSWVWFSMAITQWGNRWDKNCGKWY